MCIGEFLQAGYSIKLEPTSSLDASQPLVGTWLDIDLYVRDQQVISIPKSVNRKWLYDAEPKGKSSIIPWPGRVPGGFQRLRSIFTARLTRARELQIPVGVTIWWVGELILELHLLGYPVSLIRAITHSLPFSLPTLFTELHQTKHMN